MEPTMYAAPPEEKILLDVCGERLAMVITRPASGDTDRVAVLARGGPGGVKEGPADLYVDLAGHLAGKGIATVRFDFLGAGESSGRYRDMTITRQVAELDAVLSYVGDALRPSALALVGESYGATIVLKMVRRVRCDCVVLLWPAIWLLDETFASYVTAEKMERAERDGYVVEEGEEVGLPFLREVVATGDVSDGLRGLGVPALFVHGDSDQEVPHRQSIRGAELVAGTERVVAVPGGDHCLESPAEREIVYREAVNWLDEYL
jgi:pimeloyl-ACP methyl ester carboxylesterase